MKRLVQHYQFKVAEPEHVAIGQMIFPGSESDTVTGFIWTADNKTGICEVVLFEPMELEFNDDMHLIAETIPDAMKRFEIILNTCSKEQQDDWREAAAAAN